MGTNNSIVSPAAPTEGDEGPKSAQLLRATAWLCNQGEHIATCGVASAVGRIAGVAPGRPQETLSFCVVFQQHCRKSRK
jgi:hypothetical protein